MWMCGCGWLSECVGGLRTGVAERARVHGQLDGRMDGTDTHIYIFTHPQPTTKRKPQTKKNAPRGRAAGPAPGPA